MQKRSEAAGSSGMELRKARKSGFSCLGGIIMKRSVKTTLEFRESGPKPFLGFYLPTKRIFCASTWFYPPPYELHALQNPNQSLEQSLFPDYTQDTMAAMNEQVNVTDTGDVVQVCSHSSLTRTAVARSACLALRRGLVRRCLSSSVVPADASSGRPLLTRRRRLLLTSPPPPPPPLPRRIPSPPQN